MTYRPDMIAAMLAKANKAPYHVEESTGCWVWTKAADKAGYGIVTVDGHTRRVHRFVYEVTHGRLESTKTVTQTCGNRRCFNPDHMRVLTNGTHPATM